MATLTRLDDDLYELDSLTASEVGWLGGGCVVFALGGCLGLAALAELAEGSALAAPFEWAAFLTLGVGGLVFFLGLQLQESYLLSPGGLELKRVWLGRERRRALERRDQIHSLALDGSDRLPRRWRLMLVRQDGQLRELAEYNQDADEQVGWSKSVELAERVAGILGVPLRLPEGEERSRRLEVQPGPPPGVHYPEFPRAVLAELKGLAWMLLLGLLGIAVALGLRSQGYL